MDQLAALFLFVSISSLLYFPLVSSHVHNYTYAYKSALANIEGWRIAEGRLLLAGFGDLQRAAAVDPAALDVAHLRDLLALSLCDTDALQLYRAFRADGPDGAVSQKQRVLSASLPSLLLDCLPLLAPSGAGPAGGEKPWRDTSPPSGIDRCMGSASRLLQLCPLSPEVFMILAMGSFASGSYAGVRRGIQCDRLPVLSAERVLL